MIDLTKHRNIHCIGIGGIGLSAIAEILLSRGYNVTGSDMKESMITDHLATLGAKIYIGHRAENVEGADLLVYSAAIAEENPEIVRAKELGIPMASRAQLLGTLMCEYPKSIAVSGTHGKTTTTSMLSLILNNAGKDPTILVGGELAEIGGNVQVGHGDTFITEACEYRDSFLQLHPNIEIIMNIDSDHLDYFKDIDAIVKSFDRFAGYVPETGKIIAYDANPFVSEVVKGRKNVILFGYNSNSDYSVSGVRFVEGIPRFHVIHDGQDLGEVILRIPGEHNILNATAAFACAYEMGIGPDVIIATLEKYTGIQRRFDVKGYFGRGARLIDDYAHHPTEIRATLNAADKLPHHDIWCIFQPHTYTRTLALFDQFADAFGLTDHLILTDIYAAREKDIYNIDSKKLADAIHGEHPDMNVRYMKDFDSIAAYVKEHAEKGDLVITMGAGDVYKVGDLLMQDEK
ncbi:UDP-N-acetylmuramate--L-alanine ligase [Eubacterium pyruvativorans]|uniref:UDP-N-acetylmuramate--L-alanine ligase n=1 Tax=Eubacterium pyruvativorans TaxID=155865 RepID=UPI00088896CB|nr:UDP-N-acetylmuramate--L-alanine ligase [Eubacterium pyruvativorans]SDF12268.1 UDP-N-acetylmuramate--L-alanine ligase [Eubacterium pyruvativorans]